MFVFRDEIFFRFGWSRGLNCDSIIGEDVCEVVSRLQPSHKFAIELRNSNYSIPLGLRMVEILKCAVFPSWFVVGSVVNVCTDVKVDDFEEYRTQLGDLLRK